jgi:hypothetical protein
VGGVGIAEIAAKYGVSTAATVTRESLSWGCFSDRLTIMEVQFTPATEKKLNALAMQSGRRTDELVEDAMAVYLEEVVEARERLDSRYDDLKSGRVKPIPGEEVFGRLRAKSEARKAKSGS